MSEATIKYIAYYHTTSFLTYFSVNNFILKDVLVIIEFRIALNNNANAFEVSM
jgi:hypothetical protein